MRRSINFPSTHSPYSPLSLATLSLILFNIVSATSASLSLHAMIPSYPLLPSLSPPSLALLQSVPNSIFAFAFALFIYLFIVMLVYCFAFDCLRRLLAKGYGQNFWLYISHSLSVLWPKTETDFIRYVTQHFIMHYSCYYILQGIQRRHKLCLLFLGSPFAAFRLLKSPWLLHRFMV